MTVQSSKIGRLRLANEATFNTSEVASPSNFIDLPVVEGSAQFVGLQEHLEPEVMQQYVHAYTDSKQVLGKLSSTLALTTYLAGTGAACNGLSSPGFLTATTWSLFRLLKTLMGGAYQGSTALNALTVTTGTPTTTNVPITTNHGTSFALEGGAYAVVLPNGTIEAREILSFSASAVVPKIAHSTAPAAGAQVYWPTTFHTIEGTSGNLASLQCISEGVEASDEYVGLGMQGTFAIDIAAGQLAKLSASLTGASWARTSSFTLAAPTSIPGFSPIAHMNSELLVGVVGSTTRYVVPHSSSTWTPGISVTPIASPEGLNSSGIIGWKRQRSAAVSGQFVTYGDDAQVAATTWLAHDVARTNLTIQQQIGNTTSGIVLLSAPTAQITAAPTRTDANGLYGLTVGWKGRNDSSISVATDLGRKALGIHVF
jgi:hypothetical protein